MMLSRVATLIANCESLERVITPLTPQPIVLCGTALLLSLILGCGFTLNTPPNSEATSKNTGLPGGTSIPAPLSTTQLTGCTNPNTGTASGDWGIGSNPVYVNPYTLTIGDPVYTTNTIFWTSRESEPGKSILLTGAFTNAPKKVRIAVIPPGSLDWQSVVRSSTSVVTPVQQISTAIAFVVPSDFPIGVYGFQIEDPTAPAILGLANVPEVSWSIGVPAKPDAESALMHQVYDCGVEPGGLLRVFGKNFLPSPKVVLQASDGSAVTLAAEKADTNSISVAIPATTPLGKYGLWIGTSPWGSTSSAAVAITVQSGPGLRGTEHDSCSLIGDGVVDNTARLQKCLDQYAPITGSRTLVSIDLPAGTFVLKGGVTGSPFEILAGATTGATNLVGKPSGSPPDTWISIPQYFGMTNLTLTAPTGRSLIKSSGTLNGDPTVSGHLFFDNVKLQSTPGIYNGNEQVFLVAGPDIQVYNSTFQAEANQDFDLNFADGAIVSGNDFILDNFTGSAIEDSQNVIFENNVIESHNPLGQGTDGDSGGSGLSITRGNGLYGPSALSRDIYLSYNTFTNQGSDNQAIVLNDGDGGSYFGKIASSTLDTVTLANDPWWAWMGTTNPEAASMAIVSGTGVGQHSFLKAYSGRTVTLETPWKVVPDSTSVVAITQYEYHMTWANNTFLNVRGATVLADSIDSVVEDNHLINAGGGIFISAFGAYGGPASYGPVINTDVLRNVTEIGLGTLIYSAPNSNFDGIGIQDLPGCLLSGLLIRENIVPGRQTIFSTNGVSGITGVLIEQNEANLFFQWAVLGFIFQDNTPPPYY